MPQHATRVRPLDSVVAGALAVALVPGLSAQEFSYRDLAARPTSEAPPATAPLIPAAAMEGGRGAGLGSSGALQASAPAEKDSLIPVALAAGSEAARIYHRHSQRVGIISQLFSRIKNQMREAEEQTRLQKAREQAAREEAAAQVAARAAELARREAEAAAREEQARLALEQAEKVRQAPPKFAEPPARPSRPAAAPARASAAGRSGGTYVVQPGDSLIKISHKVYGDPTAWRNILPANGLTEKSVIRAGDSLTIPPYKGGKPQGRQSWRKRAAQKAPDEPVLDYANFTYKLYNIESGDTLSGIAARFYGAASKHPLIEKYNQKVLAGGLKAGEKLLIPLPRARTEEDRYQKSRDGVF